MSRTPWLDFLILPNRRQTVWLFTIRSLRQSLPSPILHHSRRYPPVARLLFLQGEPGPASAPTSGQRPALARASASASSSGEDAGSRAAREESSEANPWLRLWFRTARGSRSCATKNSGWVPYWDWLKGKANGVLRQQTHLFRNSILLGSASRCLRKHHTVQRSVALAEPVYYNRDARISAKRARSGRSGVPPQNNCA
jgi:hypothetical protein